MKQRLLSSIAKPPTTEPAMVRLVECEHLAPRVRELLQGLLTLCSNGLELSIDESLTEFEKQLVRLADKAPNEQQNGYFDSVHELKRGRADVMPRFLRSIENSLAHLGQDVAPAGATLKPLPAKLRLALTEGAHLDESLVLSDIATKVELRVREPLYTLGNRFGALAGTPRIATETMPMGPRSLVEALRHATSGLDLVLEHRLTLYRCFERVVFIGIASFYNALNTYLVEQGILPERQILPLRATSLDASDVAAVGVAGDTGAPVGRESIAVAMKNAANQLSKIHSPDLRQPHPSDLFATLRQALDECRRAETYTASAEDVQGVLVALQARQAAVAVVDNGPAIYTGEQIKNEILAVLRELSADGRAPRITEEVGDTVDLIAMLFEFLSRRAGADGLVQWILVKLQIPILRVAFKDKSFFSDTQHPARQVLGDLVEFSRFWADDAEARNDPALVGKLQSVTNQIASEYQGDIAVFHRALQDLSEHSEAIVRDVELAAERHVDAARNREKLELCQAQASTAISERIARTKPNEFLRTLLEQAWTDVLTISLTCHAEDASHYARRLDVVDRLLALGNGSDGGQVGSTASDLRAEVEAGLTQVGLHDDDVQAIARKLFVSATDAQDDDNPISQTELAMKLRGNARLGAARKVTAPALSLQAALTPEEQAALDRICSLAPAAWLEFVINEQGDTTRRRLSWYSAHTGRCLLVNQRGTPSEEQSLQQLAREMATGQVRIASAEQEPLLDRAWSAIIDTLKYFSTHKLDNYFGIPTLANRALDIHRQQMASREKSPQKQEMRTLLLVDDEENILRALKRVLRSDGYRILTATSARDGLEILRQNNVEVIVSDQRMPEVCGTEFLGNVKKMYPDTVRIMLSGYSDAVSVTDAINRGTIYKFLTKPWNDEDIRQQVRGAFSAAEGRPNLGQQM